MERGSRYNLINMNNVEFYDQYEERLTKVLVDLCTSKGFLSGQLYMIDELDEKWTQLAPNYMADAVAEVNEYPSVAIAWAAYLGMGLTAIWDTVWSDYKDIENLYDKFREPRGFDALDEYVLEELLSLELESEMANSIENVLRSCAHLAISMIRKEETEPQTATSFYILASTVKVLFKIGVSIELKLLGYKYEKMEVELPS